MSASDTPTGSLYIQEIVELRATIRAREATILNLSVCLRELLYSARVTPRDCDQILKVLHSLEVDKLLPKGFAEGAE